MALIGEEVYIHGTGILDADIYARNNNISGRGRAGLSAKVLYNIPWRALLKLFWYPCDCVSNHIKFLFLSAIQRTCKQMGSNQ